MTNRHTTTAEDQAVTLRINLKKISPPDYILAKQILTEPPEDRTRWFTKSAVEDYQRVFNDQLTQCVLRYQNDEHSRQIVMHGPNNGCWLSTQILSLKSGGVHVIAYYRSLDQQHVNVDAALQVFIGGAIAGLSNVKELTMLVGSLHTYLP